MTQNSQRPVTLRATSSLVVFWVVVGACAFGLADAAIRGSWAVAAHALPIVALLCWAAWFLLYRPSIRLQRDRMVVVNLARIAELPWSRISDVRRRFQIVVVLDDGSKVQCWGGPFPGRTGARKPVAGRGPDDSSLETVRIAHRRALADREQPEHRDQPAEIVRRWDVTAVAIGAALALLCALVALLPF